MDLHEVNCVITRLKELGSKPEPMTEHEMGRFTNSAMSFDEFSAWFLKHEGLPHELTSTVGEPVEVLGARHRKRKRALDLAAKPFRASLHVVGYVGYHVTKTASKVVRHSDDAVGGEAWLRANMADRTVLVFPEWAFMMRAGLLRHVLEDGLQWHERVKVVQRLRVAFDYNDVDGNNQLELDELETVAIRMNPKARLAPADIAAVWAMLNPEGLPSINFSSFVKGMLKLQEHPELSQVVPLDIPHRFTLLSLVIDSPINDDQEKLIFDQMNPLERIGVGVLRRCKPKEMDKPQLHRKVADGCEGLLHYLTDEQRSAVYWTHWSCVAQACLIGVVFTALPGLIENYLGWWFETDGLTNAYWTCPGTVHDHAVAAGSFAAPFDQVVSLPVCPYGTCTSIPANLTEFLLMGGRGQSGRGAKVGNWTNQLRPLVTECGLRNQDRCIAADWEAQESCAVSAWGPCNAPEVDPLGCSPLPATSWSAEDRRFIYFNVLNLTSVVIFIVFELSSLMYTAVRSAVLVSGAIDLRLVPLNNERAFVANMLVRAAFEMGDPEGELLGVNAATRLEKEEKHLVTSILAAIWYKGKAVITGVVLKKLTVIFFPWETAMFLKPYSGVMLATALWDSMTCHAIMKGAELRAIGVSTGIEVFNDIMDTFCPNFEADRSSLSDLASVQLLRAIGVGIVYHGSMFPTMQILLRHAVAYLNMQTHIAVSSSDEPRIDSEEEFIRDFDGLTLPETRAVLCVHMLTIVLDGSMSLSKLALWHHILERVESIYQAFVVRFDSLTVEELREFIVARQPLLVGAVARIPMETEEERKKRVVWDDAATTIQAAARGYLVRDSNRTKGKKGTKDGQHNNRSDHSDNRGRTVRDLRSGASGYRYATKKESEEMKELRVLARCGKPTVPLSLFPLFSLWLSHQARPAIDRFLIRKPFNQTCRVCFVFAGSSLAPTRSHSKRS